MEEQEYWLRLEYRLCGEFAAMAEGQFSEYWCDGISANNYFITGRRARILGLAWVCKAEVSMEEWEFELRLPRRVNSRDLIDWDALMPAHNVTGWLTVNEERKFLQIKPAAAVAKA